MKAHINSIRSTPSSTPNPICVDRSCVQTSHTITPLRDPSSAQQSATPSHWQQQADSFCHVRTATSAPIKYSDCPPSVVKAAVGPDAGVAGPIAADAGAPSAPTLSLSGDTYTDSATESHKKIKFTATIPAGKDVKDYALVNKLKGSQKSGPSAYFKVKMYGSTVDFNFPSWQVDSVDPDPVYWSDSSARWNYTAESSGFTATDDPGPALSSEKGAVYAVNFNVGLYKLADLPVTTSGTISATPLAEQPWQYSVKVGSDGSFSHPSI